MINPAFRIVVAALLALIGVVGFVVAQSYDFGSARRMGPGYIPVVLSAILVILALIESFSAAAQGRSQPLADRVASVEWRPMLAILTAVAGFALTIKLFGLLPAFLVVVGVATLSERGYGLLPAAILALTSCVGAWLVFSVLLGMTLPLIRLGF
mgnify:CR=1 FL=1